MYTVHPSVAYQRRVVENLPSKTGRSIEEWARLVQDEGPPGSKERRSWLKSVHGIGGTTGSLIVNNLEGLDPESFDGAAYLDAAVGYVDDMYSGKKAHLVPLHEALVEMALSTGPDIRVSPCRTIVPVYRNHVIAQIRPVTITRIDLGLALKGCTVALSERLLDTGGLGKGDRITHRIPVSDVSEIDHDLMLWLGIAYSLDE